MCEEILQLALHLVSAILEFEKIIAQGSDSRSDDISKGYSFILYAFTPNSKVGV
jgi:hypothetical protein